MSGAAHKALGLALLLAAAGLTAADTARAQTEADALKRHVVAIYDEDGRLLGSGASVSATGLILTAKHILEQRVAGSAPSYRMSVEVQAQRDTERRTARLVATHPHMDIAILDAPEGALIPPLLIGVPAEGAVESWYSIGHPVGRNNDRANPTLFFTMSGSWAQVEQRGGLYVMPGPPFDTGMSGGPVILDDRIVGVVSFAAEKAYVSPVAVALDYFNLLGFSTSESGLFERRDHVGQLASKIDIYEEILADIQTDRRWSCALDAQWPDTAARGIPARIGLTVGSTRRLPSQPAINAQLKMSMRADLALDEATRRSYDGVDGGTAYVTETSPAAHFATVGQALDYATGRDLGGADARLDRIDFTIAISGISGDFIRTRGLRGYSVCCAFDLAQVVVATPQAEATWHATREAARCADAGDTISEVTRDDQQ